MTTSPVVVLTGASGGIGGETARRLVREGASVALLDRDSTRLAALAAELGDRAEPYEVDVTDPASLAEVMRRIIDRFGGIDVLIANAGISGPRATVAAIEPEAFERVVEINLLGVWRTVRAALPHVMERRGHILLTCSLAAAIPCPTLAAYGATKAAVESFGRALRIELARTGTSVGLAYFGAVDTPLVRGLITRPDLADGSAKMPKVIGAPIAPSRAARAIVTGVRRRSRSVHAPWWVPALLALRVPLSWADRLAAAFPPLTRLIHGPAPR
ncbi:NADP-dependent 3-hydroxy acid dehydrogenase YdfG [Actinocorallia herbida]|uniref:NADP-dependent 3-hydroxy acid dehydrogenase YdfG n=1 Tax=Actinocorallia herbida TaxID=58109 RepID=A0A3N1D0U0_9ACTN|nr:short-chain dehydrogenase/reductase [Actinocorallia herbida]ROO87134.1 NADP-dependent 3-hydroxy acid dehydrogenase YdfG [Actinocorallia herbida]